MLILMLLAAQADPTMPPVKGDRGQEIRTHCAREWPDDFRMQAYCRDQAVEGMRQFLAANKAAGKPIEAAVERCIRDWTSEGIPDWKMIGHCSEEQARAYFTLRQQDDALKR